MVAGSFSSNDIERIKSIKGISENEGKQIYFVFSKMFTELLMNRAAVHISNWGKTQLRKVIARSVNFYL